MVEATTAHHVWPVEQYPEYQWCEWNLIALSNEEHNAMHDRETGELTDKGEYWRRKITPHPLPPSKTLPKGPVRGTLSNSETIF